MKTFRVLLVIAIALAAAGLMPKSVAAQQFSAYTSGINIQNMSGSTASISIEFYNAGNSDGTGGSLETTIPDTVDPYGVKSYFPLTVTSGFKGSVVISSDQPVAAVTNIGNAGLTSLDAYNGSSSGSTSVYLPLLHKNNSGYYSWFSVQNTSNTNTANVTVNYSDGTQTNFKVAKNASVTVYQKNENHTLKFFAGTVTSDQPVVVVGVQENASNILSYTGFEAGSTNPLMPIINMNNSGYITGTQVYNLGNSSTDVTVSYKAGQAGSDCTETRTVAAKTMVVFTTDAFINGFAGSTCVKGQRFIGSAQVTNNTTNQNLAVVVNQLRQPSNTNGASYPAFDVSKASNIVFMPTIFDRNSGWYTAFNLQNVGGSTAYVKCTYANSSVTYDTGSAGLAAGKSVTVSQLNQIANKYIGSAVCRTYTNNSYSTEASGGKILTVVNQLGPGGPDNLLSYDGINP